MLRTLAIRGYRSLREVVLPLAALTVVTGANGTGKSSLYRALALVPDLASGAFAGQLARAGGLSPVQGTGSRKAPISLGVGFAGDVVGYVADIGLPVPSQTMFGRDPEIKREHVWVGPVLRPSTLLAERRGGEVRVRGDDGWVRLPLSLGPGESLLAELGDPVAAPDVMVLRQVVRRWRCHDSFRVDAEAPARRPCPGTRTPSLAADGHDLAPAVQTIRESAWAGPFDDAIRSGLEGSRVLVDEVQGWFSLAMQQPGMLRPLAASEWSEGTLRYVLLAAALLSPRAPELLVLNEPEASLHVDLLPALADLVSTASERGQVLLVTHSERLAHLLERRGALRHELGKSLGETRVADQGLLSRPAWEWGKR